MSTATATAPPMKNRNPKAQLAAAAKEARKLKAKANKDKHETGFMEAWNRLAVIPHGLPAPDRDWQFTTARKWRLDFAWPRARHRLTGAPLLFAIEINGGTQMNGRHNTADGMKNDCEKVNTAILQGWKVFTFTDKHSYDAIAIFVRDAMLRS